MRIAYFDCFAGVSGDMILGALVDAGLPLSRLQAQIDKLGIAGLRLEAEPVRRLSVAGTRVGVRLADLPVAPEQEHHLDLSADPTASSGPPARPRPADGAASPAADEAHRHGGGGHGHAAGEHAHDAGGHRHAVDEHPPAAGGHRHVSDILELLGRSRLDPAVADRARRVFTRLAAAEAAVHGADTAHVHLHEVGALDAVADVVGAVAGLALLGVEAVYASPLHLGSGFVDCAHGRLPVPVPGVVELCRGVPCFQTDVPGELVTPTGAAIITTLAEGYGSTPPLRVDTVGYGAGRRNLAQIPNLLRLRIGTVAEPYEHDQLVVLETNIDDMNPEALGFLTEQLLADGARDVFLTPVYMKKGRPGSLLTMLLDEADLDRLARRVLAESTTIGVRLHRVERRKLPREQTTVRTQYGDVRVKVTRLGTTSRGAPEYEDCARLARSCGVPILEVYAAANQALPKGEDDGEATH